MIPPTYPPIRGDSHPVTTLRSDGHSDDCLVDARLFVAIWPDDAPRDALAHTVDPVRRAAPDVRWQPPARWHITLAFLGVADPERAAARISTLERRGDTPAAGPLRLAGAGIFGPVIWVGVEHGPWLAEMAGGLQRVLHVADRRFRAHVTVGRLRGEGAAARAQEVVPLLSPHAGPAWTPREITLVESVPGPAPEYRIIERWPLKPPPARPR